MTVNWGALQQPNVLGALQQGMEYGREVKRRSVEENALAAYAQNPTDSQSVNALMPVNPQLAMRLRDDQLQQRRQQSLASVFTPAAGAPGQLLDPTQLPPRTDGLQINHDALRQLYQTDPEQALQIQQMVYSADAAGAKRMQASGELMASAAYRLRNLPPEQRAGELQALAPQLQQMGVDPRMLSQADLTDAGLDRYINIGRSVKDLIAEDTAKYMAVPAGGTLVNTRDPEALRAAAAGGGSQVDWSQFKPVGGAPSSGGATFP